MDPSSNKHTSIHAQGTCARLFLSVQRHGRICTYNDQQAAFVVFRHQRTLLNKPLAPMEWIQVPTSIHQSMHRVPVHDCFCQYRDTAEYAHTTTNKPLSSSLDTNAPYSTSPLPQWNGSKFQQAYINPCTWTVSVSTETRHPRIIKIHGPIRGVQCIPF